MKLARNEASHERVTALEIEIDVMKADKNVLESQTAEQRIATYALRERERYRKRAAKELAEEAQRVAKAAAKAAKWTAEVDEAITHMITDGSSYANIASKLGNGLKGSDINNRWTSHLLQ